MHSITAINLQQHVSEGNDSASITSFAHMASGIINPLESVENQTMILQSVTEEKTVELND